MQVLSENDNQVFEFQLKLHDVALLWRGLTGHRSVYKLSVMTYQDRITIETDKRNGQPCIRGLRITVSDVFQYLASGMSLTEILSDFPELTVDDIRACFAFAADRCRQ